MVGEMIACRGYGLTPDGLKFWVTMTPIIVGVDPSLEVVGN